MNPPFGVFSRISRALILFGAAATMATPLLRAEDLQVQPGRIFLGSLTYGGKTGEKLRKSVMLTYPDTQWTLVRVDLSKAPGVEAQWNRTSPTQIRVDLDIDLDRFVEGRPYGALVKRLVRIETGLVDEPQVLISLTGMTSQNATEWNFSDFRFQGQERWQGWWSTPNIAGSVLAVACVFLTGGGAWFWTRRPRNIRTIIIAVTTTLILGVGLYYLTRTYSRGAWVACAAGLGMLFFCQRSSNQKPHTPSLRATPLDRGDWAGRYESVRKWMRGGRDALLSIGLGWGLLIVALPEGLSRAGSSLQVQEDKSIRHRLHVWEGALQMMAEHPGKGVGADQFGKVFPQLYQIPLHKDEYSTAISDYFTWAAERGVWVVGAWTGLLVFLLVAGGLLARNVQQSWMAPFVGALLTLGLASAFSSLGFVREIQAYWGFLAGALLLIYLWRLAYGHLQGTRMVWMARAGFFVLAACAGWWILGQWALSRLPTLTYPITANESVAQTASGWVSLPCHTAPQGIVWYFPDNNEDEATLLRTTIRPLAARGWVVICTSPNDSAVDVATLLRMEQQALGNKVLPRHLAGHSRGGTAALLTALRGKEQIKVDSVSVFGLRPTSEDREARTALGKDAPPLRIMHSKWDDQAPFNPVSRLVRDLQTSGSALKVVWVDEEVSRNSPMWQEWVNFVGGND